MRILAYGATGLQANPMIPLLLAARDTACVRTRRNRLPPEIDQPGVQMVTGDVNDPESLIHVTQGIDAVAFMIPAVCTNPDTMMGYIHAAMAAAAAAKAKMVVWNTSARFPEDGEDRPEASALKEAWKIMQGYGVPVAAVAPAKYFENLLGPWNVESVTRHQTVSYPVSIDRKIGWIAAQDVCAFIVKLLHRSDLAGQLYRLSGPENLTGPELAQAFQDVLRRDIGYYAMTADEMYLSLSRIFDSGSAHEVAESYRREQNEQEPPRHYHDMAPVLRDLPMELTPAREWVAHHADAFASVN